MQQTPLPVDQPQGTSTNAQPPADRPPVSDESNDLDGPAPVSDAHSPSAAPSSLATAASGAPRNVCRQPAGGHRACDAIVYSNGAARVAGACNRSVPYCASDLQAAYGVAQIAKTSGRGALVAIVAAYGYPNAAGDLAVYRKAMGLPVCAAGCLQVVDESGRSRPLPKPNASDDWRLEQALDLDMVSAICPNCRILLVQTNGDKNGDLALGVNTAVTLGAVSVANPYSSKEDNAGPGAYRHPGRAITASAGNDPGVTASPCSYSGVVCVGGTSLLAASSKRGWSERPWGSGGSGCSAYVQKPAWQRVKGCATRNEVDVAAVADPATGIAAYESPAGGWQQMGGTSAAATIVAALFALGSNAARANAPQWIWGHGPGAAYHHVGSGPGYDRETGWGTPAGVTGF